MDKYFLHALLLLLCQNIYTQLPAFPNAQGGGMYASGGRGGNVYEVTNLNDSGFGSLRDAVSQPNRTIVFKIGGVINLRTRLNISQNNITIAGQTAPGDGICVTGHNVFIRASNIIIRYMRFRLGDVNKIEDDALSSYSGNYQNIIIDHCSISWGVDEVASFYDIKNFTLQYCIISESLYSSFHSKGNHGYGGIWGGENATYHHNLIAHHSSRPPRLQGNRYNTQIFRDSVELSNNVIFNWGTTNSVHGGEGGAYNMRNNYYRAGPATPGNLMVSSISNKRNRILQYTSLYREGNDTIFGGRFYVNGNVIHGYPDVTADNWTKGVQKDSYAGADTLIAKNKQLSPFPFESFAPETAEKAYEEVLRHAGASFPKRDIIDNRIINETQTGMATFGGNGYMAGVLKPTGIIDSPNDIGGMPEYKTAAPPLDSDRDGIPDAWELTNGLDPNNISDGRQLASNGYSHLENYLEALVFGVVSKSMSPFLEKVKIYPTLVLDQISIQNDQNFIINELRFYDMMGRVIANKVVAIKNGDIYTFDMSDFIAGSYLLVCNAEGNQVRYKVVKGI